MADPQFSARFAFLHSIVTDAHARIQPRGSAEASGFQHIWSPPDAPPTEAHPPSPEDPITDTIHPPETDPATKPPRTTQHQALKKPENAPSTKISPPFGPEIAATPAGQNMSSQVDLTIEQAVVSPDPGPAPHPAPTRNAPNAPAPHVTRAPPETRPTTFRPEQTTEPNTIRPSSAQAPGSAPASHRKPVSRIASPVVALPEPADADATGPQSPTSPIDSRDHPGPHDAETGPQPPKSPLHSPDHREPHNTETDRQETIRQPRQHFRLATLDELVPPAPAKRQHPSRPGQRARHAPDVEIGSIDITVTAPEPPAKPARPERPRAASEHIRPESLHYLRRF